ncbi:hypothetical protein C3Y87_00805 [Carbonactinospora thermoautotrophica]|uniref:Uncharacterized protein n=2 Tax=Carbonactinospora thermoautotrophica TaxID=1469144 RepID=A0A132MWD8_9ACTN|nr:hypothetical protein [Carbonactinospora thermoautotrophica]KWX00034.1 hypothetical protein TH66_13800 [Carbonactinospora thermoautotrophica]KWX02056.1 hypothetical protein LI90_3094 [Carbonactinospora thermoautotrophica]MCX9189980.1 hypothetical protein [Carbonactinospora thermoautotrophica]
MTKLRFTDGDQRADLESYLGRLLQYDQHAVVRMQAAGRVLGVFGRPPFEVLSLRAVALAEDAHLDVTVSAGELLESVDGSADVVTVPPPVTGPGWVGLLPPRTGWEPLGRVPADEVARAVLDGVREFRARAEALPADQRTRATYDAIATEIWSRPVVAGIPLRAAHAAHSLGFLRAGAAVAAYATPTWWRLDGSYGTVSMRRTPGLRLV